MPVPGSEIPVASSVVPAVIPVAATPQRRGKVPPVSAFSGEDLECQLDDWLPSLERASTWNAWTAEERVMQLAGHLKGCALQEYNLLRPEEKESFESAALRVDQSTSCIWSHKVPRAVCSSEKRRKASS